MILASKETPESQIALRMRAIHISEPLIRLLLDSVSLEALTLNLDCLADRKPKDVAATFVSAVRGQWAPPAAFLARSEAKEQRYSLEQQKRQKAAQKREAERVQAEREATEQIENENLNVRFELLPTWMREEIESEILVRMQFVLQHLGEEAARNSWAATRRQIMREWDEQGRLEQNHTESTQSRPSHALLSNDKELEAFFTGLPTDKREKVEIESQKRLETSEWGISPPIIPAAPECAAPCCGKC